MRSHEIEAWVLDIADRVRDGRPVEDSRVELKADWPTDPAKAARRLAGHCNAAHGEPVLWVIGIDEKRDVVGASQRAVPDWLSEIRKQFDGLAPDLIRDINVPVDDKTVVALLFSADRAPFVVKNPVHGKSGGGPVQREVPWREGTSIRSARRQDLLRLLTSTLSLPAVELLGARLTLDEYYPEDSRRELLFELSLEMYIAPRSRDLLVIPFHRCEAQLWMEPDIQATPFEHVELAPLTKEDVRARGELLVTAGGVSRTIEATPSEILISGPGYVILRASVVPRSVPPDPHTRTAVCRLAMYPVDTGRSVTLKGELKPVRYADATDRPMCTWEAQPQEWQDVRG